MSKRGMSLKVGPKYKEQQNKAEPPLIYINQYGKMVIASNTEPYERILTQTQINKFNQKMKLTNNQLNYNKKKEINRAQIHQGGSIIDPKQIMKVKEQKQIKKEKKDHKFYNKFHQKEPFTYKSSIQQEASPLRQELKTKNSQIQDSPHIKKQQSMILKDIKQSSASQEYSIQINSNQKGRNQQQANNLLAKQQFSPILQNSPQKNRNDEKIDKLYVKIQKLYKLVIQKLEIIESTPAKVQNQTEIGITRRIQRLIQDQRQRTIKQRQAFWNKVANNISSQYSQLNKKMKSIQQSIKNSYKLEKNAKQITLQNQNAQLKVKLKRKDLTQQQHEKKIQQMEKSMKEYQGIKIQNNSYKKQIQKQKILQQQVKKLSQFQEKKDKQNVQQIDFICSNLLNFSPLVYAKSYIKQQIQVFQSQTLHILQLLFQKDHKNSNLGIYMDNTPFPFLLLIQTEKDVVFGAYSNGYQTYKSRESENYIQQKQKKKAFLFNINNKQIFINDRKTNAIPVQYKDSMLTFGNWQMVIKNNNLETVKVNGNNIIGQCYYTIKHRKMLTGQQEDIVKIKRLQIHRVYFKQK